MITISFVIPVYNEEKRLDNTFKALSELQLPRGLKLEEVIFVNDGSTDKTSKILFERIRELSASKTSRIASLARSIKTISYKENMGKGYAVKQGMLASTSDYTLMFDADMSTPLSEIAKFMPFMEKNIDVVIGTRKNGASTVIKHQPLLREAMGHVFTQIAKTVLQTNVTDFTCGFKAFSKAAKEYIFSQSTINGWAYDSEVIFLSQKGGFSLAEKSVIWGNENGSKVNLFKAIPQTVYELLLIRKNNLMRVYQTPILVQPSLS